MPAPGVSCGWRYGSGGGGGTGSRRDRNREWAAPEPAAPGRRYLDGHLRHRRHLDRRRRDAWELRDGRDGCRAFALGRLQSGSCLAWRPRCRASTSTRPGSGWSGGVRPCAGSSCCAWRSRSRRRGRGVIARRTRTRGCPGSPPACSGPGCCSPGPPGQPHGRRRSRRALPRGRSRSWRRSPSRRRRRRRRPRRCRRTSRRGRRERHGAEVLERGALGSLSTLEDGAVLALAEVSAERASLGARQLRSLETRERELGLLARQPALELLAESAAGAEDQGLDRADGEVEDLGDLGVRAAFELAHDEGGALVEREEAESTADLACRGDVCVLGCRGGEALVELDLLRAARRVAEALPADVVRDLDQPVVRAMRALAALERAVGVEERRLGDVLGVGLVVEDRERVAVDGVDVPLGRASRRSARWRAGMCASRGGTAGEMPSGARSCALAMVTGLQRARLGERCGAASDVCLICGRFGAFSCVFRRYDRSRVAGGDPSSPPKGGDVHEDGRTG